MTKIKIEEVISQGEYIKRLIDEQGVNNLFAEQITYLDDRAVMKLVNLDTKIKYLIQMTGNILFYKMK